jgi:hypothetical protein
MVSPAWDLTRKYGTSEAASAHSFAIGTVLIRPIAAPGRLPPVKRLSDDVEQVEQDNDRDGNAKKPQQNAPHDAPPFVARAHARDGAWRLDGRRITDR